MPSPKKQTIAEKRQKKQDDFRQELSEKLREELRNCDGRELTFFFVQGITRENVAAVVNQFEKNDHRIHFARRKHSSIWEFSIVPGKTELQQD